MGRKPRKSEDEGPTEIEILELSQGQVTCHIIGSSPYIFNRMAEKAKRELLLPRGRLNAAQKSTTLKHDPVAEFRDSVYRNFGPTPVTRLKVPTTSFKGALTSAALDMPGVFKTQVGRLCWIPGASIDFYGIPKLFMAVVRSAGINKAPDIRTRAIIEEWVCTFTLRYVKPNLTEKALGNLLGAAGIIAGVGDFRQEKGKGSFGQFRLTTPDDPDYQSIVKTGGRVAQDRALEEHACYDMDSDDLLSWYLAEVERRGRTKQSTTTPDAAEGKRAVPKAHVIVETERPKRRTSGNGAGRAR